MAYFIFGKNLDNVERTLYRIAENESDLNSLNVSNDIYKIIEVSQSDFESVKYEDKHVVKYNQNSITYENIEEYFENKEKLKSKIDEDKKVIKQFLKNNTNHSSFNIWNNYYNQLNSLNLDSITYPLNKSLVRYFKDLGQLSLNPLQLP